MPLEIACFSSNSAILASRAGADRIELCSNRECGGLTPELPTLLEARKALGENGSGSGKAMDIRVMIRVNEGMDFTATSEEVQKMVEQITEFKPYVQGFVFGLLLPPYSPRVAGRTTSSFNIDVPSNSRLITAAHPLPCTFHRAVDTIPSSHWSTAMETIVSLGFSSILSSGGASSASSPEGIDGIRSLVELAKGRIEIIAGGGVRSVGIRKIVEEGLGLTDGKTVGWVHSSGILDGEEVDEEEVRRMKIALDG